MSEDSETLPDETEEPPETLQLEPLELVNRKIPLEFWEKFRKEIIVALRLTGMGLEAAHLTSELDKILTFLNTAPCSKKRADDTQNSVEELVIGFNQSLEHFLAELNRNEKAR